MVSIQSLMFQQINYQEMYELIQLIKSSLTPMFLNKQRLTALLIEYLGFEIISVLEQIK